MVSVAPSELAIANLAASIDSLTRYHRERDEALCPTCRRNRALLEQITNRLDERSDSDGDGESTAFDRSAPR